MTKSRILLSLAGIAAVAMTCHAANAAYCRSLGDETQLAWEDAPESQRESAIAGVEFHLANPDAGDEASHESWMAAKTADGWVYGEVKDADAKTHPCIKPFAELPPEQQFKDTLFRAIVHSVAPAIAAIEGKPLSDTKLKADNKSLTTKVAALQKELKAKPKVAPAVAVAEAEPETKIKSPEVGSQLSAPDTELPYAKIIEGLDAGEVVQLVLVDRDDVVLPLSVRVCRRDDFDTHEALSRILFVPKIEIEPSDPNVNIGGAFLLTDDGKAFSKLSLGFPLPGGGGNKAEIPARNLAFSFAAPVEPAKPETDKKAA